MRQSRLREAEKRSTPRARLEDYESMDETSLDRRDGMGLSSREFGVEAGGDTTMPQQVGDTSHGREGVGKEQ